MSASSHHYVIEKLTTAISILVSHPGDARQRLNDAYLAFHTLQEHDFPPELREKWSWVIKEMTKFGPILDYKGDVFRGSVENTMRRIQKRTASKIIEVIYDLYWTVSQNEKYL